jgi:hypothetical protein
MQFIPSPCKGTEKLPSDSSTRSLLSPVTDLSDYFFALAAGDIVASNKHILLSY